MLLLDLPEVNSISLTKLQVQSYKTGVCRGLTSAMEMAGKS